MKKKPGESNRISSDPSKLAKVHFDRVFNLLWDSHPFLEALSRRGCKLAVGSQNLSLKSFVRNTMQKTYGPMLKTLERRETSAAGGAGGGGGGTGDFDVHY